MQEKDRSQTSNKKQLLVVGICLLLIVLVIFSVFYAFRSSASGSEFRILAGLKRQAHLHLQVRQKRNI